MKYRLQDLIDVKQFQSLQERLNEIYRFPSAIIDNDGNILTATAWQDVCTKFHRVHPECEKECIKSDQYILSHLHEANPAVSYRCPHGLVDNATPIIIEGVHYGNFFTGQFFLEKPDLEFFREQARRYGFEEEAYLAAVQRVPIWSKEQLNSYLFFIKGLIEVISQIGLKSLKEAETRHQMLESSRFNQQVIDSAHEGIIVYGTDLCYQVWNPFMERLSGRKAVEVLGRHPLEVFPFLRDAGVIERLKLALSGTVPEPIEFPYQAAGRSGWNIDTSAPLRNSSGEVIGVIAVVQDITESKRAQAELRESEEKFKTFFECSNVGMAITHLSGKTLANQALGDMLGLSPAELRQLSWTAVTHPDDVPETQRIIESLVSGKEKSVRFTKRYLHKNGSVVWADLSSTLRRDAAGRPLFVMSTIVDITARKQAHDLLSASEARLRTIIDISPVPIALNDDRLRITFLNSAFVATFGYTQDDLQTLSDWWPLAYPDPAYRRQVAEDWQAALEQAKRTGGRFMPQEVIIRCKDGTDKTVLASAASIAGKFEGEHLVVLYDISERKQSEKTLHLRGAALEAAANAIVITNLQGTIEWANPAFTVLSGWELADALGKNPRDLVKSGKHDAAFYRQMWETILAGSVWHGEVINRRRDGELRTENMTITPVRDAQGAISHFIAIKQDVTRQKAVEEHLLQAQRIEAIGTLASGVAHDLNNILAPILLVAGLLKDAQSDTGNRELLAMVQSSAKRGSEIVKQLLTFSRGQKGERIPVQLRHLIKEIMMVARETFPRNIELHQDLANDLWTITADPTQMHQVLLNLCVNARDAMPKGGHLTIGAANVTLDEHAPALALGAHPGPYLAIKVRDTGHGIPPEIRHRIFDPFFTTKPLGAGTGLGLSTVLGVVQNHGGFVTVDSVPDQGTTFTVFLPAQAKGALAFPLETAAPTAPAESASSAPVILLVDDEPAIIRASKILLERHGFSVITAVNGQDALIHYLQNRAQVRLVLSDLMMPVMNGVDLVRALRALDPALRIIVTSGLSDVVPTEALAELGVGNVLKKPCDPNLLIATVHQQLAAR